MKFHPIPPDCIDFLPEISLEWLRAACNNTPANILSPNDILDRARNEYGQIYLVNNASSLLGVLYLIIFPTPEGGVLNIVTLGGKNLLIWKDELRKFARKLMIDNNIKTICLETRPGWGKLFPELKEVGTIYTASLVH